MYQKRGFTLIELLVVVLIIGILSAVALPQYQTAVLKSRYSEMMQAVHMLKNAEEVFFMTTGAYTTDINLLDISFPVTGFADNTGYHIAGRFHCSVQIEGFPYVGCWRGNPYMGYTVFLEQPLPSSLKYCFADKTSFQVCSSMGGMNPVEYDTGKYRFILE